MNPPPYSESEFQCALHDSWIGRAVNLSKKRAVHGRGWIAQPSVIENIECLESKLQRHVFSYGEVLCKREIHVNEALGPQAADGLIPEAVTGSDRWRRRADKARSVVPLRRILAALDVATGKNAGPAVRTK